MSPDTLPVTSPTRALFLTPASTLPEATRRSLDVAFGSRVLAEPGWGALAARLLCLGGHSVDGRPHAEELLPAFDLLERATWFSPSSLRVTTMPEAPTDDAWTAVGRLWRDNPAQILPVEGYALAVDGVWRRHWWTHVRGRVVETGAPRAAYYGAALRLDELGVFTAGG